MRAPPLGVDVHGAELPDGERPPVLADALLLEQRRARGGAADEEGRRQQQRRERQQHRGGAELVDRALGPAPHAGQVGVVEVQHRQPVDRPDGGAVARDVHQRRGHDQVHLGPLQPPGQAPQRRAVELGAGQDDHGVGPLGGDGFGDAVEGAPDAGVELQQRALGALGGQAGRDHAQAVVVLAPQLGDQRGHGGLVPDQDHPFHAAAPAAHAVEPLAEDEAHRDGDGGGRRDGDEDEHPRGGQFEPVGDHGDGRGERDRGVHHALVLLGADEQVAALEGPREAERGEPDGGHGDQAQRVDLAVAVEVAEAGEEGDRRAQEGGGDVAADDPGEVLALPRVLRAVPAGLLVDGVDVSLRSGRPEVATCLCCRHDGTNDRDDEE